MSEEHTPIPWGQTQTGSYDYHINTKVHGHIAILICGSGDERGRNKANAEFIVQACNSHKALVEACEIAVDLLKFMDERRSLPVQLKKDLIHIEAALALAKGE